MRPTVPSRSMRVYCCWSSGQSTMSLWYMHPRYLPGFECRVLNPDAIVPLTCSLLPILVKE